MAPAISDHQPFNQDDDMPTLLERVQDLPAELFDEIRELVFTLDSGEVQVDGDYKPPSQLQVNRATREDLVTEYYSTKTFVMKYDDANKWAKSLVKKHHELARSFKFRIERAEHDSVDGNMEVLECRLWPPGEVRKCQCYDCDNQFFLNMWREKSDGTFEEYWEDIYALLSYQGWPFQKTVFCPDDIDGGA